MIVLCFFLSSPSLSLSLFSLSLSFKIPSLQLQVTESANAAQTMAKNKMKEMRLPEGCSSGLPSTLIRFVAWESGVCFGLQAASCCFFYASVAAAGNS